MNTNRTNTHVIKREHNQVLRKGTQFLLVISSLIDIRNIKLDIHRCNVEFPMNLLPVFKCFPMLVEQKLRTLPEHLIVFSFYYMCISAVCVHCLPPQLVKI
jgi:hypothetical protein